MYGSFDARSSLALPSNATTPSFSMMNSASSAFFASASAIRIELALPDRFVRGDEERVAQLMGDDDRGDALEVAQLQDLFVHGHRRNRVEPGGRFVVEQDARLGRHRARDGDAAALSAGELGRHALDVLLQAHETEHLLHAPIRVVEGHVALLVQLVADVLFDGERVEERPFLKHHADIGTHVHELQLTHPVHALPVDEDRAAIGPQQSQYELQNRGLAGAAAAEDDLGVARQQLEAHVLEDDLVVEGQRDLVEHDGRDLVCVHVEAGFRRA